jgi:hypothetical protein
MYKETELIRFHQNKIEDIYEERSLRCIRGLNNENEINGRNVLTWHHKAVSFFQKRNDSFNFFKNEQDIKLVSDEIIYFVANAYLYLPYINDPIEDRFKTDEGNEIYPNYQNMHSKLYDMYVDVAFEKIYNFWDRIGDLIAACLVPDLDDRRVYFTSVIDKIPHILENNENFKWLLNYRNNSYKSLNDTRKEVVHYFSTGTNFQHDHIYFSTDLDKLTKIIDERKRIPEFLKKCIDEAIEGYTKTLDFLIDSQKLV